jgi:hypothetical protein
MVCVSEGIWYVSQKAYGMCLRRRVPYDVSTEVHRITAQKGLMRAQRQNYEEHEYAQEMTRILCIPGSRLFAFILILWHNYIDYVPSGTRTDFTITNYTRAPMCSSH